MDSYMALFRIYIDEVGNHDLKSAHNPSERFLSLTGVIIESDRLKNEIYQEIEDMKERFFHPDPDEPVILHRREILKKTGPFRVLQNQKVRQSFNDRLLSLLNKWEFYVATVVIDKLAHLEQYRVWRAHPYHYCLQVLLERYFLFLQQNSAKGDVLVESRGGKEDQKLMTSYSSLYQNGTNFIDAANLQSRFTSTELKVKPKLANIDGLQIADLVAYPSRREILKEKNLVSPDPETFCDRVTEVLQQKYLRNPATGEIWGYGKKWLP
jgi:hypothetical protein